jgi:hypothetical protein
MYLNGGGGGAVKRLEDVNSVSPRQSEYKKEWGRHKENHTAREMELAGLRTAF